MSGVVSTIKVGDYHLPTITPFSSCSLGVEISATSAGAMTDLASTAQSSLVSTNTATVYPFKITRTITAATMFLYNGGTATGNVDVGVYDANFSKVVSIGSTAQSGTNTYQSFNITDTVLVPGQYYLAYVTNNDSTTVMAVGLGLDRKLQAHGCYTMGSAFPLPATFTPSTTPNIDAVVMFGLSQQTVV